jgi:hypothetical protein
MEKLTINPGEIEGCLGRTTHRSPMWYDFSGSIAIGRKKVARQLIIVCYAGFEAQLRFNPSALHEYSEIDYKDAFELSRDFKVLPRKRGCANDDPHASMRHLRDEAKRLVKREWSTITAVALRLLQRRTLQESDVKEIWVSSRL